jgi:heme exporter protein D
MSYVLTILFHSLSDFSNSSDFATETWSAYNIVLMFFLEAQNKTEVKAFS